MRRCVYPALFVQASPSSSKPLERYPVNIRVGKASSGHWGGAKRRWERAGGDTHPKCAQHKENPSRSGAPSGIRMLSSQEFPGKFRGAHPALRNHSQGIKWVLPRGFCPRAPTPPPPQRFLPTAGFKHGIFPIWEKRKRVFFTRSCPVEAEPKLQHQTEVCFSIAFPSNLNTVISACGSAESNPRTQSSFSIGNGSIGKSCLFFSPSPAFLPGRNCRERAPKPGCQGGGMWGCSRGESNVVLKGKEVKSQTFWSGHTTPALFPALPIIECCSPGILHLLPAAGQGNQQEFQLPGAGNVHLKP